MIGNILRFIMLLIVFLFFITVYKYYFSNKNMTLMKNNRENIETKTLQTISKLPVLLNDTSDVIEFNSGYENSDKKNFKRSFGAFSDYEKSYYNQFSWIQINE